MKTKTHLTLSALIALTSITFLSYGNNPGFQECVHLFEGNIDGTYTIVPTNQSCPAIPFNWHPGYDPSKAIGPKNHRIGDPLCTIGSLLVDL